MVYKKFKSNHINSHVASFSQELSKDCFYGGCKSLAVLIGGYCATLTGWQIDKMWIIGWVLLSIGVCLMIVAGILGRERKRQHATLKAKGDRLAIYVAQLEGDNEAGNVRSLIIETLNHEIGRNAVEVRPEGSASILPEDSSLDNDIAPEVLERAREILNKNAGHLYIWGRVSTIGQSMAVWLRFISTAPGHDGNETRKFAITEDQTLGTQFAPEMGKVFGAIVVSMALPTIQNSGRFDETAARMAQWLKPLADSPLTGFSPGDRTQLLMAYALLQRQRALHMRDSAPLEESIAVYRRALRDCSKDAAPMAWGAAQIGLGNALLDLGVWKTGVLSLKPSVEAFRAALEVYPCEQNPYTWAAVQDRIGMAEMHLGMKGEGVPAWGRSIDAFCMSHARNVQPAMDEPMAARDPREMIRNPLKPEELKADKPHDWTETHANLGYVLHLFAKNRGDRNGLVTAYQLRANTTAWALLRLKKAEEDGSTDISQAYFEVAKEMAATCMEVEGTPLDDISRIITARDTIGFFEKSLTCPQVPDNRRRADTLYHMAQTLALAHRDDEPTHAECLNIYRQALAAENRADRPFEWALIQNRIGSKLLKIGSPTNDLDLLYEASMAYRAALEEQKQDRVPLEWAESNWGIALTLNRIADIEKNEKMKEMALLGFRITFQELTRERMPFQWALAQYQLGNALMDIEKRGEEMTREAVGCFRNALLERTRERNALEWANTQIALARALSELANIKKDEDIWKQAAEACRLALEEFNRHDTPHDWRMANFMLGTALYEINERDDTMTLEAVSAFRNAMLDGQSREGAPDVWAIMQQKIGVMLLKLGDNKKDPVMLRESVNALKCAQEVHTRERNVSIWAELTNLRALALNALAEFSGFAGDILRECKEAYAQLMEVYTQESHPQEYAHAKHMHTLAQNLIDSNEKLKKQA